MAACSEPYGDHAVLRTYRVFVAPLGAASNPILMISVVFFGQRNCVKKKISPTATWDENCLVQFRIFIK